VTQDRQNPAVVIIGAGMTGLLLVIKLRELGIRDITVLEKADRPGGTWRENTYPGITCDVPSHAYTYSFEPNPDWSHFFPPGDEIYDYFQRVFHTYGIEQCTRFNAEVTHCDYAADREQWTVTTVDGARYRADLLFSATGLLHQLHLPDFPGQEKFQGAIFHSARWNHDIPLAGKRIGIIGTGSSATQIVAALAEDPSKHITVFQRTPQWIVPLPDRAFTDAEKDRFRRRPRRMQRIRRAYQLLYSQGTAALTDDGWGGRLRHRLMSWNARRYLRRAVPDPALRAKLTPDYLLGCKRVVINERFYPALQEPNCRLVTSGIQGFERTGLRTADGELHALDVIVLATGFDAAAFMRPITMTGRDGVTIEQAWQQKISAYRSLLIPGFPNFFVMLGPNSPIGNQSVIDIAEHQTDYALRLVRLWQDGVLPSIEVTPAAQQRWRDTIRERMRHTVWTSGCRSWYLDADGEALSWPDTWKRWVAMMADVQLEDLVH